MKMSLKAFPCLQNSWVKLGISMLLKFAGDNDVIVFKSPRLQGKGDGIPSFIAIVIRSRSRDFTSNPDSQKVEHE